MASSSICEYKVSFCKGVSLSVEEKEFLLKELIPKDSISLLLTVMQP